MRYLYSAILICASLPLWANEINQLTETNITVFTTVNYPIKQPTFADRIYYIDEVERLEEAFSKKLQSVDPNLAEQQAKVLLNSPQGKQFQQQLGKAYVGLTESWKTGVMKVPAIVFQPKNAEPIVIYGETDVRSAIQRYKVAF